MNDILFHLPSNLKGLRFELDNLRGKYPIAAIDLTNIAHLTNLERLEVLGGSLVTSNSFHFYSNSFENVTKIKELGINVMIITCHLDTVVRYMKHLEILDLSNMNQLSVSAVQNVVKSLTTVQLKSLVLRSFQMSGIPGYSDKFNITSFFTVQQSWSIEHLDLSRNMLGVIFPSIITMLPNLKTLDISHNYLLAFTNDAFCVEMLLHPTLEVLNMENQGSGFQTNWISGQSVVNKPASLTDEASSGRFGKNTTTEKILSCINSNSHGNFTRLFNDPMIFCSTVRCIGHMSSHILKGIPCEAFGNYADFFDSSCPYFVRFQVTKNLKQFIAGNINWVNRPTPKISSNLCMGESPLRNISFGQNGNWIKSTFMYEFIEKLPFTAALKDLEELDLSQSNLASFPNWTLSSLHTLKLRKNHINPSNKSVCQRYPNLRYLSLSSNNLSSFDPEWIGACKFLEDLDLSHNSLNLTDNPLTIVNNTQLRNLNLNDNKIDTLPRHFTEQLEVIARYQDDNHVKNKLRLTFSDNNLLCQCNADTLTFITWFKSASVIIPENSSYSCSSSHGQMFLNNIDIGKFENTCFPSYTKMIAESIVGTVGVICTFVILAAMYRYRWRLQYRFIQASKATWCFVKGAKDSYISNDVDSDNRVKYDAFVSYCADDRFWVHDCLMKTLEGDQYGLRLCIHYRDFPLGEDISSVIVRSIRQSRKVIIVLSEQSIERPWCQFEFQVALSEAVKRQTKLAIIKLGQFKVEKVEDSSVAWVLDNHTYLEWHENENAQKVFWFKLLRHLYNDIDGTCCCLGSCSPGSDDITAFAEIDEDMENLLE